MKASVVDLRYKMREVLKALQRNESVQILYHGKLAGTIVPARENLKKMRVQDHPFFGMYKSRYKNKTIAQIMDELRGGRYRDL